MQVTHSGDWRRTCMDLFTLDHIRWERKALPPIASIPGGSGPPDWSMRREGGSHTCTLQERAPTKHSAASGARQAEGLGSGASRAPQESDQSFLAFFWRLDVSHHIFFEIGHWGVKFWKTQKKSCPISQKMRKNCPISTKLGENVTKIGTDFNKIGKKLCPNSKNEKELKRTASHFSPHFPPLF